jgi:hypothetical protein
VANDPNDPNLHWDGQRWLRWDGTAWTDATTGSRLDSQAVVEPIQTPAPSAAAADEGEVSGGNQPAPWSDPAFTAAPPPVVGLAPSVEPMPAGKKSHAPLIVAVVIVCLLVLGGAVFGVTRVISSRSSDTVAPVATPSITPSTDPTSTTPTESATPTGSAEPTPISTASLPSAYTEELGNAMMGACAIKYTGQFGATQAQADAICGCIWRGYVATVPFQDFLAGLEAGAAGTQPDWAKKVEDGCVANPTAY